MVRLGTRWAVTSGGWGPRGVPCAAPQTLLEGGRRKRVGDGEQELQGWVCVLEEGVGACVMGGTRGSPAVPADAGGVQVGAHPEAGAEGETGHDAALRAEAAQGPDQVPGPAVEEEQHEDHVSYLPESAAPPQ